MSAACLFVTGTDTGVGKTRISEALLMAARAEGLRAAGYKPVAAGCEPLGGRLSNEDARILLAASMPGLAYEDVNPVALEPAIAPHIAAAQAGSGIDRTRIDEGLAQLRERAELVVVEGAGGWLVPLGAGWTFADWVSSQALPVLLVVGMRLGCLNHALLSADAIRARTHLLGWVENRLPPPMSCVGENRKTLDARLPAPRVASLAEHEPATALAGRLRPWLRAFVSRQGGARGG